MRLFANASYHFIEKRKRQILYTDFEDEMGDEREFVRRFIRHSYAHFGRTLSLWEAYLLARQHGLPVRLLDWTGNPLMACTLQSMTSDRLIRRARS